MNKKFFFYFSNKNLLNDVTIVYVKALECALGELGYDIEYTFNIESIPKFSNVLTITDKCNYIILKKRNPHVCINWFQGIVPEEASLAFEGKLSKYPRKLFHNYLERYVLRKNNLNIVVSKAMMEHYKLKYDLGPTNWFVMPCFNCDFDENCFKTFRYSKPTFVYAGSMAKWQCVEQTINVFKRLKQYLPDAELFIFTREKEKALQIANSLGVEINIDSMSPEELNKRMKQYKYGLLFRDDINVNNVATPTKINNYMACGLIPVFSNVIDDYKIVSQQNPFMITFNNEDEFIQKVLDLERQELDALKIMAAHRQTFQNYWNTRKYQDSFKEEIKKILFAKKES